MLNDTLTEVDCDRYAEVICMILKTRTQSFQYRREFDAIKDLKEYLGPYLTKEHHKGSYRTIRDHTGPYGTIRDPMGPYWTKWHHIGTIGTIRDQIGPYGTIRDHVGTYVNIMGMI